MNNKPLPITIAACLVGASAVLGDQALSTGTIILSGPQSFEGEALIAGGSVVENNPVLEGDSEFTDGVAAVACEGLVLSGENSFEGEMIVTGGEVIEIDNGQVDSEGNEEPQIVICEPMMPPPTAELPEGEVDEAGGEVVEIDNGQVDKESKEGVTPTSDNGELQLLGEGSFDGEVFVTGGRTEENQRNNYSAESTVSLPVFSTGAGVLTLQRGALNTGGGSPSFGGETIVTGGKIVNRDPSAENAAADGKVFSGSEKHNHTKNVGTFDANSDADVSDSAQSAVVKGGRVFLR